LHLEQLSATAFTLEDINPLLRTPQFQFYCDVSGMIFVPADNGSWIKTGKTKEEWMGMTLTFA